MLKLHLLQTLSVIKESVFGLQTGYVQIGWVSSQYDLVPQDHLVYRLICLFFLNRKDNCVESRTHRYTHIYIHFYQCCTRRWRRQTAALCSNRTNVRSLYARVKEHILNVQHAYTAIRMKWKILAFKFNRRLASSLLPSIKLCSLVSILQNNVYHNINTRQLG